VERQHVSYLFILAMVLAAAALAAYLRHNTRDCKIARQKTREREARVKRMGER
jgi:hypothetical protein